MAEWHIEFTVAGMATVEAGTEGEACIKAQRSLLDLREPFGGLDDVYDVDIDAADVDGIEEAVQ